LLRIVKKKILKKVALNEIDVIAARLIINKKAEIEFLSAAR